MNFAPICKTLPSQANFFEELPTEELAKFARSNDLTIEYFGRIGERKMRERMNLIIKKIDCGQIQLLPKKIHRDLSIMSIVPVQAFQRNKPKSFSKISLAKAAPWLNPLGKGNEGSDDKDLATRGVFKKRVFKALAFCGASLRFTARVVYGVGVGILMAPLGILYHSLKTLHCGIASKILGGDTESAKGHAEALARDVAYFALTLTCLIAPVTYACCPQKTVDAL